MAHRTAFIRIFAAIIAFFFLLGYGLPQRFGRAQSMGVFTNLGKQQSQPLNLVQNGDFESGDLSGWQVPFGSTLKVIEAGSPSPGRYVAFFGGISNSEEQFSQLFAIPNTPLTAGRITFWVNLFGNETIPGADLFCAGIYGRGSDELLVDFGCLDGTDATVANFDTGRWWQIDYSLNTDELSRLQGQAAVLTFEMVTNQQQDTTILIDGVRFEITSGAAVGDAFEPNNRSEEATTIVAPTTIKSLTIDPQADQDYFAFTANSGDILHVDLDSAIYGTGLDTYLRLLDSQGIELAANDDDGASTDSVLEYTFRSNGTFYLLVSSYDGAGSPDFTYSMQVLLTLPGTAVPTISFGPIQTISAYADLMATLNALTNPSPTLAPPTNTVIPPGTTTTPGATQTLATPPATVTFSPGKTPIPTVEAPFGARAWTAMLYLAGDNNLCAEYDNTLSYLESSIGEKVGPSGFLNILVLFDRNPQACASGETTLLVVQPNGANTENVNQWNMSEVNTGDPQTLVSFIQWGMQNYPAEHYYLAIDNHGGGVSGIAWDESSGGDHLTNSELYTALKQVTSSSQRRIDLLAYEACLMGMYEVAYDARPFADYVFFFESISFTNPLSYANYFNDSQFNRSTKPGELGRIIFDQYYAQVTWPYAVSLIDTRQMEQVQTAVSRMADALIALLPTQQEQITQARNQAQFVENNGDDLITASDWFVDLWDVADKLQQNGLAHNEAQAVKDAIDAVVMESAYHLPNPSFPNWNYSRTHGLTIFWPLNPSGYSSQYISGQVFSSTQNGNWDEFLRVYLGRVRRGMSADPGPSERIAYPVSDTTPSATATQHLLPITTLDNSPTPSETPFLPPAITPVQTQVGGGTDGDGINLPDIPSPFELPAVGGLFSFLQPLLGALPTILQWLLIILLLLVFLWLLWLLLRKLWTWWKLRDLEPPEPDAPSSSSPGLSPGPLPDLPTEPVMMVPKWIRTLDEALVLITTTQTPVEMQDTLLIGVGPAGIEVLSQVSAALQNRFSGEIPANIRMLQINVLPQSEPKDIAWPASLPSECRLDLTVNLAEVDENLKKDAKKWKHWAWYFQAKPSLARARGRMALFYDLKDGRDGSDVWKRIERSWIGLKNPAVRIIGTTWDDTSSGMLVDLIRLIHIITGQIIDVQLWLAGPVDRDWGFQLDDPRQKVDADQQVVRSLATLRELERFQRNAKSRFQYVPDNSTQDDLKFTSQSALVQSLFLFQPYHKIDNSDNSRTAPEDDVLACMADSLLTLFNPVNHNSLIQHLSAQRVAVGHKINTDGIGMTSALGSYSLRSPAGALERAVTWRMLHDVLFEKEIGIFALESCTSDGKYKACSEPPVKQDLLEIDTLLSRYQNVIEKPQFIEEVRSRVESLINGGEDMDRAVIKRRAGLSQAIAWLKMLQTRLRSQPNVSKPSQEVRNLIEQLEAWQAWGKDNLLSASRNKLEAVHKELSSLNQQPGRSWVVDRSLEWNLYRQTVRTWEENPKGAVNEEPLLRLARRFGWQVLRRAEKWEIRLLAPDPTFTWYSGADLDPMILHQDPEMILKRLLELAKPLAHAAVAPNASLSTEAIGKREEWMEYAKPRLALNKAAVSSEIGQLQEMALWSPPLERGSESASDPYSITLLRAIAWAPLRTTDLYKDELWEKPVRSDYYVWEAEQGAARMERLLVDGDSSYGKRFSAKLVSQIAADQELFNNLCLAYLYKLMLASGDGWQAPGVGTLQGKRLDQAFAKLFVEGTVPGELSRNRPAALQTLNQAIVAVQTEIKSQPTAFFQEAKKNRVAPLMQDDQPQAAQELGLYLHALARNELEHILNRND